MTDQDDELLQILLQQLDADSSLSDAAGLLVFAAYQGDDALNDALSDCRSVLPAPRRQADRSVEEPLGAHLRCITVEGFRGVGPARTLEIAPGPGLTVVCGRNGSGKSSFAEAVELALTGDNQRWGEGRAKEWREGWRNLHHPSPARIDVELLVEGAKPAATLVTCSWDDKAALEDATVSMTRAGQPARPLSALGWDDALSAFRPFLPYNDLGRIVAGRPSDLYDALWNILGLGRLTETQRRLTEVNRRLKADADDVRSRAKQLAADARGLDDERARRVLGLLGQRTWDLDAFTALAVGGQTADDAVLRDLAGLAELVAPSPEAVREQAEQLRAAHAHVVALRGTSADTARRVADLLERAIAHHHADGDMSCPVCGRGRLDDAWHADAQAQVVRLREEASAVLAARSNLKAALDTAASLFPEPPPALDRLASLDLTLAPGARDLWDVVRCAPSDAAELADHLDRSAAALATAIEQVARDAAAALHARQDRWRPLAERLAAWVTDARPVLDRSESLKLVAEALTWIKAMSGRLANARLAPLAAESARIWEQLRQESNVSLGPIRLEGSATRRRVNLDVTVDGFDASALGVMSQGELHALALSLFLPRATLAASPFRFLVIDDPVQAMDPAKVDGLARVLHDVARRRQVVVFTHDDRLPAAVRRLQLPATVLEVTRREGSVVDVVVSENPPQRYLDDARALTKDRHVDAAVAAQVVPGLCRLAIDSACVEATRFRRLGAGQHHHDVETLIDNNPKLYPRMALALFDDPRRTGDVLTRLRQYGSWAPDVFTICNKGAHAGADTRDLTRIVQHTADLVARLRS